MGHFLLVYDQQKGLLLRMERFETSSEAMRARYQAEDHFVDQGHIEVVTLSAGSEEALRKTHGRYFLGLQELAANIS